MADQTFPFNFIDSAMSVDGNLILSVIVRTVMVTFLCFLSYAGSGTRVSDSFCMYELIILIGLGSALGGSMIYEDMTLA